LLVDIEDIPQADYADCVWAEPDIAVDERARHYGKSPIVGFQVAVVKTAIPEGVTVKADGLPLVVPIFYVSREAGQQNCS